MSRLESRVQKLEGGREQGSHWDLPSIVCFHLDGALTGMQREGAPYDGPLEGHRVTNINFVSPPEREPDPY